MTSMSTTMRSPLKQFLKQVTRKDEMRENTFDAEEAPSAEIAEAFDAEEAPSAEVAEAFDAEE